MSVEKEQLYRACNPLDEGRTLRVLRIEGDGSALVVTVYGPSRTRQNRPRWISTKQLHATAVTRSGQPRRSGYALVKE